MLFYTTSSISNPMNRSMLQAIKHVLRFALFSPVLHLLFPINIYLNSLVLAESDPPFRWFCHDWRVSSMQEMCLLYAGGDPVTGTYAGGVLLKERPSANIGNWEHLNWLVVWNMNVIFPYIGLLIIPVDFHIFQRGGPTTNQPVSSSIFPKTSWPDECGSGNIRGKFSMWFGYLGWLKHQERGEQNDGAILFEAGAGNSPQLRIEPKYRIMLTFDL